MTGATDSDRFYSAIADKHLSPLWTLLGGLTEEPTTPLTPHLWTYAECRELLLQAGEIVPIEHAARRVLGFRNPGLPEGERTGATDTLWAALQLVLPGEVAPAHRHTPSALRFIIEGDGAYTVVDGQSVPMNVGDFLVTPNGMWHEHGHRGEGPMIWLDGLDSPMMTRLRQYILQDHPEELQEVEGAYPAAYADGTVDVPWTRRPSVARPMVYRLEDTLAVIEQVRHLEGDPFDDVIVEYRNPLTGGPVMRTIAAHLQLIRPGRDTRAHRHTHSVVYHCVRGSGHSVLDGQVVEWGPGDTFAVPMWTEHSHHNPRDEDAILFSYTDKPAIEALGLARERDSADLEGRWS